MKKKRLLWCVGGVFLAAVVAAGCYFFMVRSGTDPDVPQYSLQYLVRPEEISSKLLSVTVRLTPEKLPSERMVYLGSVGANASRPVCVSDTGTAVAAEEYEDVWQIGPIDAGAAYVDVTYDVKLGESAGSDTFQVQGDLYDDLLVFQGKQVLMLPWIDQANLAHIERYIPSLQFRLESDRDWASLMPFTPENSREKAFLLENPTRRDLYDISNSSFCFGYFESLEIPVEGGESGKVYLDRQVARTADTDDLAVVSTFYRYYAQAFGAEPRDCHLTLLRNGAGEDVILGGAGGRGTAISLEMVEGNECQTMSRSIYHAFFDSIVKPSNLRYEPNMWLYKGLADYYVEASAEALSPMARANYGIVLQDGMERRYLRYLYYSVKDGGMTAVSPASEGGMSIAQDDFYYGVKVPLILYAIETVEGGPSSDLLLRYLAAHGQDSTLDVNAMMRELLGGDEKAVRQYLSGESYVPNYWSFAEGQVTQQDILDMINGTEADYALRYEQAGSAYPQETVGLLDRALMDEEIAARGLSFGTSELQELVRGTSETVYYLLMQDALRADLCGIEDMSAPGVRAVLARAENLTIWLDYLDKAGFERQAEDV